MIREVVIPQRYHRSELTQGGIQNRIFAARAGRGYTVHVFLNFLEGDAYRELIDMGFSFKTVKFDESFVLHGVRPKRQMSLIGIPVRSLPDVKYEIKFDKDRLRFPLSHQAEDPFAELPELGQIISFIDRVQIS